MNNPPHWTRLLLGTLALSIFSMGAVPCQAWNVQLVRGAKTIESLELSVVTQTDPSKDEKGNIPKVQLSLKGSYPKKDFSLVVNDLGLIDHSGEQGRFEVPLVLDQEILKLTFMAVSPDGEMESEEDFLVFQPTEKTSASDSPAAPPEATKRFFSNISFGYTSIQFEQTDLPSFNQQSLTVKASVTYALAPPRWDLGISAYGTFVPLSISEPTLPKGRYLGLNARVGYNLPWVSQPWRVSIMAGGYYAMMQVADDAYGFKAVQGPQLFPTISRILFNKYSLLGYFKFSPVSSNFKILDLGNREIASGLVFSYPLSRRGTSLSFGLDISNLRLHDDYQSFSTSTISLVTGYGF